jgi:hypothetical protein
MGLVSSAACGARVMDAFVELVRDVAGQLEVEATGYARAPPAWLFCGTSSPLT